MKNEILVKIAEKYKKTPAQVALRWNTQRGVTVLPKSVRPERLHENIDIFDFALDEEDMNAINKLEDTHKQRVVDTYTNSGWSDYE